MRARMALLVTGLGLAACTPADEEYCRGFGVAGTPEFGKCMDYYHRQQSLFDQDRVQCDIAANGTYPRSLYDGWHTEYVQVFGPYGFPHTEAVTVSPDYYHNQQVDALRMRIVEPCMQALGWNSGTSWQAGRHAIHATPANPPHHSRPQAQPMPDDGTLPWLK